MAAGMPPLSTVTGEAPPGLEGSNVTSRPPLSIPVHWLAEGHAIPLNPPPWMSVVGLGVPGEPGSNVTSCAFVSTAVHCPVDGQAIPDIVCQPALSMRLGADQENGSSPLAPAPAASSKKTAATAKRTVALRPASVRSRLVTAPHQHETAHRTAMLAPAGGLSTPVRVSVARTGSPAVTSRYVGIAGGPDGAPLPDGAAGAGPASASFALRSRIFATVASKRGCEISPESTSSNAVLPS